MGSRSASGFVSALSSAQPNVATTTATGPQPTGLPALPKGPGPPNEARASGDHDRQGERDASADGLAKEYPGKEDREDRFEVQEQRCARGAHVLESPREARGREHGADEGDRAEPRRVRATDGRLAILRAAEVAERRHGGAGVEQRRRWDRSRSLAELLDERRRDAEGDGGQRGESSAATQGVAVGPFGVRSHERRLRA